jgi:hypothetical protein
LEASLDPKTGKPIDYDPRKTVQDYAGKAIKYGRKAIDVRPARQSRAAIAAASGWRLPE